MKIPTAPAPDPNAPDPGPLPIPEVLPPVPPVVEQPAGDRLIFDAYRDEVALAEDLLVRAASADGTLRSQILVQQASAHAALAQAHAYLAAAGLGRHKVAR